jgi:hypothetical protein
MRRVVTTIFILAQLILTPLVGAEDSIRIATWNIQNFGITNATTPHA